MSIAQQIKQRYGQSSITDPRPDLEEDSALWTRLLELAGNEKLRGVLHGFRCGGTRIRQGKSGYILRPDIDPTGRTAWESQAMYDEMKAKYLVEWKAEVAKLLKRLEGI